MFRWSTVSLYTNITWHQRHWCRHQDTFLSEIAYKSCDEWSVTTFLCHRFSSRLCPSHNTWTNHAQRVATCQSQALSQAAQQPSRHSMGRCMVLPGHPVISTLVFHRLSSVGVGGNLIMYEGLDGCRVVGILASLSVSWCCFVHMCSFQLKRKHTRIYNTHARMHAGTWSSRQDDCCHHYNILILNSTLISATGNNCFQQIIFLHAPHRRHLGRGWPLDLTTEKNDYWCIF